MKQLQRRRWKYSFALLVSLSVGSLLTASSVFAYQEVTVTDGGTITGKVTLKGNKPAPRGFNLVIFPDPVYCGRIDRKSTRLNSSHDQISYAVFCLKKKIKKSNSTKLVK